MASTPCRTSHFSYFISWFFFSYNTNNIGTGKRRKNLTTENSLPKANINNAICSWLITLFYKVVLRCIHRLKNSFPKTIITSVASVSHFKRERWFTRLVNILKILISERQFQLFIFIYFRVISRYCFCTRKAKQKYSLCIYRTFLTLYNGSF